MDAVKIGLLIDLGLILFFVIHIVIGRIRGMVKILRGFLVPILAILLASSFHAPVANIVQQRGFFDRVETKVTQLVDEKLPTSEFDGEEFTDYERANLVSLMNQFGVDRDAQEKILNDSEDPKQAVADLINRTIAKAIAYVIVFVSAVIVLSLVFFLLGLLFRNALLRSADKLLGMFVGGLRGVLVVMIIIFVLEKLNVVLFAVFPQMSEYMAHSHVITFLSRVLQFIL